MHELPRRAVRVTESRRGLPLRNAIDEDGAEQFILPLRGVRSWVKKELRTRPSSMTASTVLVDYRRFRAIRWQNTISHKAETAIPAAKRPKPARVNLRSMFCGPTKRRPANENS
jgi:hypothetical protein